MTLFVEDAGYPRGLRQELEDDLRDMQRQAFSPGTIKNLLSQWRAFYAFVAIYRIYVWPVTARVLCLFMQFLSYNLKAPSSIYNYITGVHTLHLLTGQQAPSLQDFEWKITVHGLRMKMKHAV